MLEYNRADFNLVEILHNTGFLNVDTKKQYKVYGVRQDRDFDIALLRRSINNRKIIHLKHFFTNNGFSVSIGNTEKYYTSIGLNRKIREDIKTSTKIIKTIILYLENKLEFDPNFKIQKQ
jgi:hypothetical protein